MQIKSEKISNTQMKLNITVPHDDMKKFLERAAKKISLKQKIKGFRPGKASYDVIKQQFGEMTIYQEAVNSIVDNTLLDAMKQQKVDYVGKPNVDVTKLVPQNDLEYTVTFDLMPEVTLAKDWKKISIKVKDGKVEKEQIDAVINDLKQRQGKQVLKEDKAAKTDKVILDFVLTFDNVQPENGTAQNFEVVIGDNKMIPGFEEELIGLKAEDTKEFEVSFPKDYYQKGFADKKGKFNVTIKHVFTMETPEMNEEFAKNFGFESIKELNTKIEDNLQHEMDHKLEHEAEVEMFEKLVDGSKFSELPVSILDTEKETMIQEMRQNVAQQGLKFEDYLAHIKKTEDQLKDEMSDDAIKRVKSGLLIKTIREEEKIEVSDAEVDEQVKQAIESAKDNVDMKKQFESLQYKMYVKNSLAIRKVTAFMKENLLEGRKSHENCNH